MLNSKTVLVTGAARRIGASLARHLHGLGYHVYLHYLNSENAATQLTNELNQARSKSATPIRADLSSIEDIETLACRIIHECDGLDALINNASSFYPTAIDKADENQWNDLMSSNLKAPFFLSQKLYPHLKNRSGCIVNIADIFAERPMPGHAIYSIAKAGNKMMTQALALEFAPDIRVNAVAPGAILWPEDGDGTEIINNDKLKYIPAGRLGGSEAIVKTVDYLIHNAPYTTGEFIKVDGGRTLCQ